MGEGGRQRDDRESARKFMKASLNACQEEAPHAMFIRMQTIEQNREGQNNIKVIFMIVNAYDRLPREEM